MVTDNQRKAVWEALLDADYQQRYWQAKACGFARLERMLQILLAILSSTAVFTLLSDFGSGHLLKVLAFLTAVLATVQPFLNLTRRSIDMISIASGWHELEIEYDSIWRNLDRDAFSERKFKELRSKEVEIYRKIGDLPTSDVKLQKLSFQQVLLSRGLGS